MIPDCSRILRLSQKKVSSMIIRVFIRVFIGVGLFALGYFVGKEIGRTESIRDELRRAAEEDDQAPRELASGREVNPKGETGVCLLPAGGWPIAKSNISIRI